MLTVQIIRQGVVQRTVVIERTASLNDHYRPRLFAPSLACRPFCISFMCGHFPMPQRSVEDT